MRSCWRGIEQPPLVEEHYDEEEEETNPEEEEPTYAPFGDVPMLPCPIRIDVGGSSSAPPPV